MNVLHAISLPRLLLAAAGSCALLAGATEARAATLVVDRDKAQCPHASYASIQQAVDAAQPGDTVKVCADRYPEQVTVDKPLTVHGETPADEAPEAETGATAAGGCSEPIVADPTLHAIVDPDDGGFTVAFKLRADEIALRGLVVQGASVGIDASDGFSGYRLHGNVIQGNTLFGVDIGSSGERESRVDHNCVRGNGNGGLVSELDDDSNYPLPPVATDPEPYARELVNARIDHNETTGNWFALMLGWSQSMTAAAGAGRNGDVTIAHNRSRGDVAGIFIGALKDGAIVHNEISETTGLLDTVGAIMIGPGSEDVVLAHNRIHGGTTVGITFPFLAANPQLAPTRRLVFHDNEIRSMRQGLRLFAPYKLEDSLFIDNTVSDNRSTGMNFLSGTNNTLERNTVTGNGSSGISLGRGVTGFVIRSNRSDNNRRNGIGVGAGATGHRIEHNSMHGNGTENPALFFDANDANFARNVWIDNDCDTDFPHGAICGVG